MTPKRIAGHEIIDPATWRAHASFMLHQAEEARRMAAEEQAKRDECPDCATLRAQLAGVRERQNSGKIWSHVRSALDRAGDIRVGAVTYEEENAKLDEIARTCESRILAALGGDA